MAGGPANERKISARQAEDPPSCGKQPEGENYP